MNWHPPLSPIAMLAVALLVLAAMACSYVWSRRQLDPRSPQGMITIALRVLGFLLLLFFLLQPARLPGPETITVRRTLAVLIDNSSSMSAPNQRGVTRLDEVRQWLGEHQVMARASEQTNIAVYGFDARIAAVAPEALATLDASGRATDIAAALEQVARQHRHDDLAGVLLISDGRVTQGVDPRQTAVALRVPIYTLPVGEAPARPDDQTAAFDLAIEAVSAQPRVILGRSAHVAVSISARGYEARQVNVELLHNDQVIAATTVAVSPAQPRRQALFNVQPNAVGRHTYQVRIPLEPDELDAANNASMFSVEVVDPVNRLLYVDRLRNERRFLMPVINSQRNLRFTAVVQQDEQRMMVQGNDAQMRRDAANFSDEQLRGLKAVVIGDLPAVALGSEQIDALVNWVDHGGALLMLAGSTSLGDGGFAATPLARLLPVELTTASQYVEEEYQVQITPDGAAHPAFQRVSQRQWGDAPSLLSRLSSGEVKPAATVLFAAANRPDAPIVVTHNYGHGKVAIVLTDSTWRWQLGFEPTPGRRTSEHELFWQQMIDWLLPDLEETADEGGQVQVITDRLLYEVGDEVVMLATVRGLDGRFLEQAQVEFTIAAPDGRPLRRQGELQRQGGEPSAFSAAFEARVPGEYAIAAVARLDGRTLGSDHATVRVEQPQIEFLRLDPDRQLLRDLAEITAGRYLEPGDLSQLPQWPSLAERKIELQPSADADAEPAWNRWWLLAAFLTLMSAEWYVRRKNQWV